MAIISGQFVYMKAKVINIEKPSQELIQFMRDMRDAKQAQNAAYMAQKDKYFSKNK